jgi:autotransporter-associated beta strand protein
MRLRFIQPFLALFTVAIGCQASLGQSTITWSSPTNSAWLTNTNWTGSVVPGVNDIARFVTNPTGTGGVGINMNGATNNGTNNQAVGAIFVDTGRTENILVGNSSTTAGGTLTLNGGTVNSIANTVLANLSTGTTLTVQNIQGSGNQTMSVRLGAGFSASNPAVIQAATGSTVTVSSIITQTTTGTRLSIQGGGTVNMTAINTFSGGVVLSGAGTTLNAEYRSLGAAPGSFQADFNVLGDGTTLNYTNTSITLLSTRGVQIGPSSGTGGATIGASGVTVTINAVVANQGTSTSRLTIGGTGGSIALGGTNTYSGGTTIASGAILNFSANGNLGATPGSPTAGNVVIIGQINYTPTNTTFAFNANRGIAVGPASGVGSGVFGVAQGSTVSYTGIIANNASGTGNFFVSNASGNRKGGTFILGGSTHAYTGSTGFQGGATLNLDYSAAGSPTVNMVSTGALSVLGGTLNLIGADSVTNSQTFGGLSVATGPASIVNMISGAGGTMNLVFTGTASRTTGGTIQFNLPTSGSISMTAGTASTILTATSSVAYASMGTTDWAAKNAANTSLVSGSSVAGFYTGSTATTLAGNANVSSGVDTTLGAAATVTSLRFGVSEARAVNLGTFTLTTGGVMVSSDVGASANSTISNGTIRGPSSGADLVVFQHNISSPLIVSAVVANNTSASGLTKAGAGNLILAATNTYTGSTLIAGGTLTIGNNGTTGSIATSSGIVNNGVFAYNRTDSHTIAQTISGYGDLNVLTGTLVLTVNSSMTGAITIASGATLSFGSGGGAGNLQSASAITNNGALILNRSTVGVAGVPAVSGAGTFEKAGTGTSTQSNPFTYTGTTTVSGGSLIAGENNMFSASSDHIVNATLSLLGTTNTIKSLAGNASGIVNNGSTSAAATITINSASSATSTVYNGTIVNGGTPALNVVMTGNGAQTLTGNNTYTGTTQVTANATLLVNGTHSGTGAVTVNGAGATLGGSGTIGGATTVTQGAIRGDTLGSVAGNLTIANALTISATGKLRVEAADTSLTPNRTLNVGADSSLITLSASNVLTLTNGFTIDLVSNALSPLNPGETYTITLATAGGGIRANGSATPLAPGTVVNAANYSVSSSFSGLSGVSLALDSATGTNLLLTFTTPVPEPASVLALAVLALGIGFTLRRWRLSPQ